jgi:hypothetical protein
MCLESHSAFDLSQKGLEAIRKSFEVFNFYFIFNFIFSIGHIRLPRAFSFRVICSKLLSNFVFEVVSLMLPWDSVLLLPQPPVCECRGCYCELTPESTHVVGLRLRFLALAFILT